MNDVERLESMRGRVQHLGTVSQEDTRWLWEMAREAMTLRAALEGTGAYVVPIVPPLEPRRKRCRECGGDGGFASGLHGREFADCPACGGSGYQPLENPE